MYIIKRAVFRHNPSVIRLEFFLSENVNQTEQNIIGLGVYIKQKFYVNYLFVYCPLKSEYELL